MQDQEDNINQNDDLFQYQTTAPVANENAAETVGENTMIPEELPPLNDADNREEDARQVIPAPVTVKAPLLFSDHAPIPTRDGEVEQEPGYSRKHTVTEQEKTFTPLSVEEVPQGSSLGQVLVLARQKSGYSIERVCEITRISQRYVVALETDDFASLPPGIFGPAYIRTISKCYRLPDPIVQAMLTSYAEHKARKEELSAEFLKNLSATATPVNEAEERRMTYIFYGVVAFVAAIIIIGLWALISVLINVFDTPEQDQKPETAISQTAEQEKITFDQNKFKDLTAPIIEEKHMLLPQSKPQIKKY